MVQSLGTDTHDSSDPVTAGLLQLSREGLIGLTQVTESAHQAIISLGGLLADPAQPTSGLTGLCYQSVRLGVRLLNEGVGAVLTARAQEPALASDAFRAILNGVLGDHLVATNNPLSTPMQLRVNGCTETMAALRSRLGPRRRVVLFIHGACMHDGHWCWKGHHYAESLTQTCDLMPVFLLYNSGRHISDNGQQLARLLESLMATLPAETQLDIVAHSMGGLVARSACYYGRTFAHRWLDGLGKLICLGSPHHGALLERAGNWVDYLLGLNVYARPFSRLGKIRSSGVTDLRYGNIVAAHWQGACRFEKQPDQRMPVPLPEGVACYAIAGDLNTPSRYVNQHVVGDGLVTVNSALGIHSASSLNLGFAPERCWVARGVAHPDLLGHPLIAKKLQTWMRDAG